jgi:hypothetical protein
MFIKAATNTPIEDGLYDAQITKWEEAEGDYGPQIRWTYDLGAVADINGDIDERTLTGYTSQKVSPKSKLWALAKAAGLDPAQGVDPDKLVGCTVTINVILRPGNDGGQYNRIDSVAKPMKAQPVAQKPRKAPALAVAMLDEDDAIPAEALEAANW